MMLHEDEEVNPVFIVGLPRSGTTLLSQIVNASRELYIGPETHLLQLFHRLALKKSLSSKERNTIMQKLFSPDKNPFFYLYELTAKELAHLQEKACNVDNLFDLLAFMAQTYAQRKSLNRWGEKTPGHYLFAEELLARFPQCRVINVIRDPRDVYLSYSKVPWGTSNPYNLVLRFRKNVAIAQQLKDHARFTNVHYEDLIRKPEYEVKRLAHFINIRYSHKLIHNFNSQQHANFNKEKEYWKATNTQTGLRANNAYKWKNDKNHEKTFGYISRFLEKEINALNYQYFNNNSVAENQRMHIYFSAMQYYRKYKRKIANLFGLQVF